MISAAGSRLTVAGLPVRHRCLVMGIVNVTPDSFSDGGTYFDTERAVRHGLFLAESGADIVDVGGESTRPGAGRITESEERRRVLPVVRELAAAGVVVSVDTTRAAVAAAAISVGAAAVNDVSGGLADPAMAVQVAEADVAYIAMHWRGPSRDMQQHTEYRNVVTDVATHLRVRLDALVDAGMRPERIVLDPGLGFGKQAHHDWELLAGMPQLLSLGRPVLVGASRKSFLGALLAAAGRPRPSSDRDAATTAVTALVAAAGAYCVRVHDVASSHDAVRVAAAFASVPASVSARAPA